MPTATAGSPPALLQIVREPWRPGSDAAFAAIEEERARISATLGCPHPYLGALSLSGPKEAWWFNGYQSSAQRQQVYDAYAKNALLMAAFQQSAAPKAALTLPPTEIFATYRPERSKGAPWLLGHGRYLVVTVTSRAARRVGTVFDAADGTCVVITAANTRDDADAARDAAGHDTTVLAVRPPWSFPAAGWMAADPEFWRDSPAFHR
jgi:hypothetical protein